MSHAAHDLEALRLKSRIDDLTGCWHVRAARHNGSVFLWCPPAGKVLTLTAAMAWLMTGSAAKPGTMWVATCGNTDCGNPAHRKLGTRSLLMKVQRPELALRQRALIQAAHLRRLPHYSPELRAEIMGSDETNAALASRLGMHRDTISLIRRGKRWARLAPGASVFNLAAGA